MGSFPVLRPSWISNRRSLVAVRKSREYDAGSYDLHARLVPIGTSCSYLRFLSSPLSPSWRYRRRSMASPWSMLPATRFLRTGNNKVLGRR